MRTPGTRGSWNACGGGLAGFWRGQRWWQRACLLGNVPLLALYCFSRPAPAPAPPPAPVLVLPPPVYAPPLRTAFHYIVEPPRPSVPLRDPFRPWGEGRRGFRGPMPRPGNPEVVLPRALRDAPFVVGLRTRIDRRGIVREVTVLRSSGSGLVDLEAVRTVRRWRYLPALRNGRPEAATKDIAVAVGEGFHR